MKSVLISTGRRILHTFGVDLVRYQPGRQPFPPDFDQATIDTVRSVSPYTRTSPERIFALCEAFTYIVRNEIPGDIVECGVWRGGSMMAAARTLARLGERDRHLYLFDTFEGMPPPGEQDVSFAGARAAELLQASRKDDAYSLWCYSPLEEVRLVFSRIDYDERRSISSRGVSRRPSPSARRRGSPCCGSTPTGTSRRATSLSTCFR